MAPSSASSVRFTLVVIFFVAAAASFESSVLAQTSASTAGVVGRANPASQNCVDKGGRLTLEENGKGGQFSVCTFPDNLQCEEWSMLRGDCRTGGIKVTGFATPAGRYCAISGGDYAITSGSNTPGEQGTCSFKSGPSCTASAYFDGTCTRNENAGAAGKQAAAPKPIRAFFSCAAGKTIGAVFTNSAQSHVALTLSDGRKLSVPQAMSGSGARYANSDETFVFWNKGNTAIIEENGKTTYSGCATKSAR